MVNNGFSNSSKDGRNGDDFKADYFLSSRRAIKLKIASIGSAMYRCVTVRNGASTATLSKATATDPAISNGKCTPKNIRAQLVSAASNAANQLDGLVGDQHNSPNAIVHMKVAWSLGKLASGTCAR